MGMFTSPQEQVGGSVGTVTQEDLGLNTQNKPEQKSDKNKNHILRGQCLGVGAQLTLTPSTPANTEVDFRDFQG